jgi:hypothetical protein
MSAFGRRRSDCPASGKGLVKKQKDTRPRKPKVQGKYLYAYQKVMKPSRPLQLPATIILPINEKTFLEAHVQYMDCISGDTYLKNGYRALEFVQIVNAPPEYRNELCGFAATPGFRPFWPSSYATDSILKPPMLYNQYPTFDDVNYVIQKLQILGPQKKVKAWWALWEDDSGSQFVTPWKAFAHKAGGPGFVNHVDGVVHTRDWHFNIARDNCYVTRADDFQYPLDAESEQKLKQLAQEHKYGDEHKAIPIEKEPVGLPGNPQAQAQAMQIEKEPLSLPGKPQAQAQAQAMQIEKKPVGLPEAMQIEKEPLSLPVVPQVHQQEKKPLNLPEAMQIEKEPLSLPVVPQVQIEKETPSLPGKQQVHQKEKKPLNLPGKPQVQIEKKQVSMPEAMQIEKETLNLPGKQQLQIEKKPVQQPSSRGRAMKKLKPPGYFDNKFL